MTNVLPETQRRNIPLARPTFGPEEEEAVAQVLRSGWVTQGPAVAEFEARFAEYTGAKYAVAVSNCTTALQLSLLALGIGEGDEVICPSQSFIATANAIVQVGATPVFADVNRDTYTLDPASVEACITPRTKAIIPVHTTLCADIDAMHAIADKHGLLVLQDAAPAIGNEYNGVRIGKSDDLVCFSFHPRKPISTGEGGMVTTNNADAAEKIRLLRHHYMGISDVARHNAKDLVFEHYDEVGFNYRMSDIQAAVGNVQMDRLPKLIGERRKRAAIYNEALPQLGWLVPPVEPENQFHTFSSYIVQMTEDAPISRDDMLRVLMQHGIGCKRGIMNSHLEPAYIKRFGRLSIPNSEWALDNTFLLPLFADLSEDDQQFVLDVVRDAPNLI